jgi:hypothetical protein
VLQQQVRQKLAFIGSKKSHRLQAAAPDDLSNAYSLSFELFRLLTLAVTCRLTEHAELHQPCTHTGTPDVFAYRRASTQSSECSAPLRISTTSSTQGSGIAQKHASASAHARLARGLGNPVHNRIMDYYYY